MPPKFSKPRSNQMNYLSYQPAIRQTDTKGYQWQKVSQFVKSCQNERHLKSIYPEERRCTFLSGRREDEIVIQMFLFVCRNQQLCLVSCPSLCSHPLSQTLPQSRFALNHIQTYTCSRPHICLDWIHSKVPEGYLSFWTSFTLTKLPSACAPASTNSSEASSRSELHSGATRRLKYPLFKFNGLRGEKCCS